MRKASWPRKIVERSILEDCLANVDGYQVDDFLETEAPDFKHRTEALWIEVTQVTETEGRWQQLNATLERLCSDLANRLRDTIPDCGFLLVTLTAKSGQRPSRADRRLEELVHFVQEQYRDGGNGYFADSQLPERLASEFRWITIRHDESPGQDVRVVPNTVFTEPEHLPHRVEEAIRNKEAKRYREKVGEGQLWLVVQAPCRRSEIDAAVLRGVETDAFDRIYLVFDYDPETKSRGCDRLV